MPEETTFRSDRERAEALVREYLRCCLTVLGDDPMLSSRAWFEAGKSLAVVLVTTASPGEAVVLSACACEVVSLLVQLAEPTSAEAIRDALEQGERTTVWGLRTVKRALRHLMDLGLVGNRRKKPRGYFMTGKQMTLFRRKVGTDPGTVLPSTSDNTGGREGTEAA
jgi:hypothetical protein